MPLTALRNDGGRYSVWLIDPASSVVQERAVDVLGVGLETARVRGELKPGDNVVALGVHLLHANQKVRLGNELAVAP